MTSLRLEHLDSYCAAHMAIAPITAHFYQSFCFWVIVFLTESASSKSDTDLHLYECISERAIVLNEFYLAATNSEAVFYWEITE